MRGKRERPSGRGETPLAASDLTKAATGSESRSAVNLEPKGQRVRGTGV